MFKRFIAKTTAVVLALSMASTMSGAADALSLQAAAAMDTSELGSGYLYSTEMRGLTAFQLVSDMGAGWNLGNTLESANNETYWGNPTTTKAMIDAIAARGFTTLRVPVRWDDHYTNSSTYTIDSSYMDRVETVVNYGLANDMYVILNVHHNDLQQNVPDTDAISAELSAVWTQIGERFKNYGDKLIFEVNNEPRSGDDWTGNSTYYDSVNKCNEAARSSIRATGGNNTERLVMLPTYCASGDAAKAEAWTKNADDNMIAASIHAYLPFDFAFTPSGHSDWLTSDLTELQGFFDRMYTYFLSKGIPVVIGEFGAVNKSNTSYREQYTAIYGQLARQFVQQDIPCVWWDNNCFNTDGENFGIFNRRANSFVYDGIDCGGIADGLINAYDGNPICETATSGETVIFEGSATESNYKQPVSFSPDYVTGMDADAAIYVNYSGDVPYLVLQSWTNGDRWITVDADSNSNGVLTFKYSKLLSEFGGSFTGLDKVYISAKAGTTTITKVYVPGAGAHTHSYNGAETVVFDATETTQGRKAISCSYDGCTKSKIEMIPVIDADDDTTTPDDGGDTTTPDDGGDDTTTPDGGDDTTTPDDDGDDTTTPDDGGDDTTTPDGGDDTTTPDDGGDDTTTPDDGDDTTTPDDGGDDTTTPDDGSDDTTTPDDGGDDTTAPSLQPITPVLTVKAGDGHVDISWDAVEGAQLYRVFVHNGRKFSIVCDTKNTSYTMDGLTNGSKLGFLVLSQVNGEWSTYTTADIVYAAPEVRPEITSVTPVAGGAQVTWSAVNGAVRYRIFNFTEGVKIRKFADTTDTSIEVKGLKGGVEAGIIVLAQYANGKWTSYCDHDIAYVVPKDAVKPYLCANPKENGDVYLIWSSVPTSVRYKIMGRVINKDGTKGEWQLLDATRQRCRKTINNLDPDVQYEFLVRGLDKNNKYTPFDNSDLVISSPLS